MNTHRRQIQTVRAPASHFIGPGLVAVLALLWVLMMAAPARAGALSLTGLPDGPLGRYSTVYVESDHALGLEEVQALQRNGRFRPGTQPVPTFGIGSRPVWVHLTLSNPSPAPMPMRLIAGMTWMDQLDVYLLQGGARIEHFRSGASVPNPEALLPAMGYGFALTFPPGLSELYLRAATDNPLVMPIELQRFDQVAARDRQPHYGYGFLYGFLIALLAYYGILYVGLRQRSLLYYALYLLAFILLNLAYTGHGYAWFWSAYPGLQRYVILGLMVTYGCCGLLFAGRFLQLAEQLPRTRRLVQGFALAGTVSFGLSVAIDSQRDAALVAFSFVTLFTVVMVLLGALSASRGRQEGRYFLAAVVCGMLGASLTSMSVWGWIPFTLLTYHGVEAGQLIEATLLALALAYRIRHIQQARLKAEYLAWRDPLTDLYNRRAFFELAQPAWHASVRSGEPLSVLVLDVDHFKQINDRCGHAMGDEVLVRLAGLLRCNCRSGDILARWGGEEFVLLLPRTGLEPAAALAERIRQEIETWQSKLDLQGAPLTASVGVAGRKSLVDMEAMIHIADQHLYLAKAQGRNRVVSEGNARVGKVSFPAKPA